MNDTEVLIYAVKKLFASDEGKVIIEYLENYCFYDCGDFVEDARRADYLAGRRSVLAQLKRINKEKSNGI